MPTSIPKYDYPEHCVDNVWSAISLAEQLRDCGEFDLFRGQRHTFDIKPSAHRDGVNPDEASNSLNHFATWIHETPDLASLHGNEDAILAVAQHYGLKTTFLDFSYSPRIAGFFATDKGVAGDTGTIICINRDRFNKSWEDLNKRNQHSKGYPLTEIVEIDVKNLWRLQAQQGAFVRCNVDPNLLEMFSEMLHIYFPQDPNIVVESSEQIYPVEKSHLEILIDQYFLIEGYPKRMRELEDIFGSIYEVPTENVDKESTKFFIGNKPPAIHPSWETSSAMRWLEEPDEKYGPTSKNQPAEITLPAEEFSHKVVSDLELAVSKFISKDKYGFRVNLDWKVSFPDGNPVLICGEGVTQVDDEWTEFSMSEMLNSIYSGMRYLPYTDNQISRAISRYIIFANFGVYEVMENTTGIEFEGGSVRGRGFCDASRIRSSLRDDFFQYLKSEKLDTSGELGIRNLLFAARKVQSSYEFEKFVELFVEDLIPTQAVLAVEGLVIGLNPMRIEIMGES